MEYLALYRKYRPTKLDEVVGQNEIKKILANSVKNGTITHAYLFSGPRGTGKTTMAKILAKMVNCENPVDGNACNKCNTCKNILNSSDIIEIDAASNNGVDEIRELREKVNLVPSCAKYKVYIIDEVHMLTTQAFNALLKTLEEPPKHVIFILATTEYYKIPLTITSRCQKFQFSKISNNDIVDRLKKIARLEKIDISVESLEEIAKISDGGMRDSINFLDQLRSFNNSKIMINDVYDICGSISADEMSNLFVDIKNNNAEAVTAFFEDMNINGKNYNKFFEDVIGLLKDIILYKQNVNSKYIKYNIECIKKIDSNYTFDEIFYLIDSINSLIDKLKNTSRQSVVVIANFLIIMCKLNNNGINCDSKKVESEISDNDDNYEVAFKFTDENDDDQSKLTENYLHGVSKNKSEQKKYNDINKEIIINNAFAVANKEIKKKLQQKFKLIDTYLTDKKFSFVASILLDTVLQVAGNQYIILTGNYDEIIDKIVDNYNLCNEFLEKLLEDKYNFVVINNSEWEKYRNEYINNIKDGNKYVIKDLVNEKIVSAKKIKKKSTVVDKLFDLVGEEIVEFK